MCARIIQNVDVHILGRIYRVQTDNTDPQIPIRWNGPPGERYHVCAAEDDARSLRRLRWGLTPPWSAKADFAPHNARCETAASKPTFREAWKRRRAVLPVRGWYEWRKHDGTPFLIADAAGGILHLAALWERWDKAEEPVESFTIITTAATPDLAGIHERQPAIIPPGRFDQWLDPDSPLPQLLDLVREPCAGPFEPRAVSTRVNRVSNDDPGILDPLSKKI